jgi:VWFA-related protein
VRLPIFVRDERGRFDPTLEMSDVVVVEDDVPQEIRSLRRLPASVLILIDTNNTVDFLSKTTTARDLAWQIISNLHAQDQVALMQFADRTELLQDWTTDRDSLKSVLRTKLHSGRREYLGAAIEAAAEALQTRPAGSRQVVLITDGMETPGGKVTYSNAVKRLMAAQVTVHVISYTSYLRLAIAGKAKTTRGGTGVPRDATASGGDPTMPTAGPVRNPSYTLGSISFDPALRRRRQALVKASKQSEQKLVSLAAETGGRVFLPSSEEEMVGQGPEIAREIGAQYVVTYTPKRPLAYATSGEYRRVKVALRRAGLTVRARPGYVAQPQQ